MSKITIIGSFVMDMVATVEDFPREGQTLIGKSLRVYPGGKGANQCVACARLGGDVEMIGMVGNDGYGKSFGELFRAEGIKCDRIFVTDKEPTAIAQIQINRKAENKIVVIPSANYAFGEKELDAVADSLKDTSLVVAQLELRLDVTERLIRLCHRLGVDLILNPAPAVPLDRELLGMITYLTPNETEMEILSGLPCDTDQNTIKAAERLLSYGVKNIVATLGSRGAMIANAEGIRIIEGYRVEVVDTVAAGDSFNGALARCITNGMSLDDSVHFANAVGALAVTKSGAIPSLPTLAQVNEFINAHKK